MSEPPRSGYSRSSSSRPQQTQTRTQQAPRQQMPPQAGTGNQAPAIVMPKQKLFEKFGQKFGIDQQLLIETLKATAFKTKAGDQPVTNEQLVALLIVADQYGLNPFTKEIYAYPDKQNGIVPVVSVDGWIRIINEHPQFNGFDIEHSEALVVSEKNEHRPSFEWMTVTIYRKDREHPTVVTEYFDEVYRRPFVGKNRDTGATYEVPGPWQSHPKRLHRHKTLIQGGRVAFGFAGIYDEDEATRIIEDARVIPHEALPAPASRTIAAKEALRNNYGANAQQSQAHQITPTQAGPGSHAAQSTQTGSLNAPEQEKVPRGTSSIDEQAGPTMPKAGDVAGWKLIWSSCKTPEALQEAWGLCVDIHDAAQMEISLEIEAPMDLKREALSQKS